MQIIRRLYLYLVSAISLTAVTWAVILLARLVLREQIGEGQLFELASLLAIIIVGLPIFLFHWLMAQWLGRKDADERGTVIRRVYLWGMLAVGVTPVISNIYDLLDKATLALVGVPQSYNNLTIPENLAAIVVWGVVLFYLWWQLQADDRLEPPDEADRGVRRLYWLGFCIAGLVMINWGAIGILTALLNSLATGVNWREPVATGSVQLLIGAAVWLIHWLAWQRAFFSGDETEEQSIWRKIYLYLGVFIFSVMAVVSGSVLLKRLIELLLGAPLGDEPLLSQLSETLPWTLVGAVFWAYHWFVLRQDAAQAPEAPRQAGVRRIYSYLVAAIGLAVLLSGITGLLSILIELLTSAKAVGLSYYRDNVATAIAMLLVGGPVWALPWSALENVAAMSPAKAGDNTTPAAERRSLTRKIYLYFYVFAAALLVFGSAGWFVYHLLTALLGAKLPADFITQVLVALVISLLAIGVWLYHWQAIRRDGKFEQANRAAQLAEINVVVLDGDEGRLGRAIVDRLRRDLPGVQVKPIGLTSAAVETMAGQPFSAGALGTAHYIVGAWPVLTAPEAAAVITDSPALKLAAPTGQTGWVWLGQKERTLDYYAQQTARGVKQAIAGDEISPSPEINVGTIVAILGGFFVLQFIAVAVIVGVTTMM